MKYCTEISLGDERSTHTSIVGKNRESKRPGDTVQKDDIIAAIEETAAPLRAAIFVSDREGPRIRKGMTVQLDLTPTVRREP